MWSLRPSKTPQMRPEQRSSCIQGGKRAALEGGSQGSALSSDATEGSLPFGPF